MGHYETPTLSVIGSLADITLQDKPGDMCDGSSHTPLGNRGSGEGCTIS